MVQDAPDMPALVHSTSDVLLEGGTCRCCELDIALIGKQFAACFVRIGCGPCLVVEQDEEPFNGVSAGKAVQSTLPMLTSCHVRRSRRPCHTLSKHKHGLMLSPSPELTPSHGLPRTEKPCPRRRTHTLHRPLPGSVPEPLRGRQHQFQQ